MADTGAPWNIPYVEPTDLVRDYPAADEAQADAIAAGLTAAGGLVAVKSAIFTGTQTHSTLGGANFAVTDLTITHEVADASNRLIISAFLGVAATSGDNGAVGLAIDDGTSLIAVGAADGVRVSVTAGGVVEGNPSAGSVITVTMPSVTFVHTPGAGSKIYTARAINLFSTTKTLFVNRTANDSNSDDLRPRAVSSLVIQEVKV